MYTSNSKFSQHQKVSLLGCQALLQLYCMWYYTNKINICFLIIQAVRAFFYRKIWCIFIIQLHLSTHWFVREEKRERIQNNTEDHCLLFSVPVHMNMYIHCTCVYIAPLKLLDSIFTIIINYYIEDITWPRGDTKFLFSCWKIFHSFGGSVVEWLGRRILNPEVPGSSPVLTTIWSCFSAAPGSTPRPRL